MVHDLSDELPIPGRSDEGTSGRRSSSRVAPPLEDCLRRVIVDGRDPNPGCPFRYDVFALPLPERALISRIRSAAGRLPKVASRSGGRPRPPASAGLPHPSRFSKDGRNAAVITGIGDDCSVLRIPANHDMLVTTDFSLEGVHFRRDWHPPESVGHRCLARGLSDIASMGGEPVAVFLSLALPPKLPQSWVDGFLKGLLELANQFDITLAGGDTSRSPDGILADIMVLASVPKGKAILRSGARPKDRIYVTGELGGSAAVLNLLNSKLKKKLTPTRYPSHFSPTPRIDMGRILRERGIASSMIDISDGLSTDLFHLCEESGVGAEIRAEAIPQASIGKPAHKVNAELALHGGEDYELLFTARRGSHVPGTIAGVKISEIGRITRSTSRILIADDSRTSFEPRGWEHFRT
jgi:thiamine-monophosphate kinase